MSRDHKRFAGLAAAAACLAATSAHAIQPPSLLTNGSFESGVFVTGTHIGDDTLDQGSTTMPGWTVVGFGNIGWFSAANAYDISASDGSHSIDLTGNTDSQGGYGGLRQTVGTVVGQVYHLTFDLGSDSHYGVPVSVSVTAAGQSSPFASSLANLTDSNANVWTSEQWDFTATGKQTVITLQGTGGVDYIGIDNVALTGPAPAPTGGVPEPAAWALMLVGFGGMGGLLRRQRAQRVPALA